MVLSSGVGSGTGDFRFVELWIGIGHEPVGTGDRLRGCAGTDATRPGSGVAPQAAAGKDPATIKPCELVSAAESEAIVGTKLAGTSEMAIEPARVCTFMAAEGGVGAVSVGVVDVRKTKEKFRSDLNRAAEMTGGKKAGGDEKSGIVDVPGLGDSAAFVSGVRELHVLKGGVQVLFLDSTKDYGNAVPPTLPKLADKALSRM